MNPPFQVPSPLPQSAVALVTGAARGIGKEIALRLASAGHRVAVNFCRSNDAAQAVVNQIRTAGGQAVAVQGDVSQTTDREEIVRVTLAEFGQIDVLVNNAGITSPGRLDLLEATEESWELVLGTNLKGPYFLSQRVAKSMLTRPAVNGQRPRGVMVNISSISAFAASTNRGDYCISKAGLSAMTKLFAARLAEDQIDVFEVCPGIIHSDMTASVQEKYNQLITDGLLPQKRWGQDSDVAQAVAALVQGHFPYCTGETVHIDGGFHIRRL